MDHKPTASDRDIDRSTVEPLFDPVDTNHASTDDHSAQTDNAESYNRAIETGSMEDSAVSENAQSSNDIDAARAWEAWWKQQYAHAYATSASSLSHRRLHPFTVIVGIAEFLRGIAVFLALAIGLRIYGGEGSVVEFIITMLGAFRIVAVVARYTTFRYGIVDGSLVTSSGIIFRQRRSIPLGRIQNINITKGVIHRILGVAEVNIETASGSGSEAKLSVVSLDEALWLRATLTQATQAQAQLSSSTTYQNQAPSIANEPLIATDAESANNTFASDPATDDSLSLTQSNMSGQEVVVYKATWSQLVLAGATHNRAGALIGTIVGLGFYIDQSTMFSTTTDLSDRAIRLGEQSGLSTSTTIGVIVTSVIAAGWLMSIVSSVVKFYGFTLTRGQGKYRRAFGLFTRHENVFPVRRVQMLRVVAPYVLRQLGYCKMLVDTAGSFTEKQEGSTTDICPIIRHAGAEHLASEIVSGLELGNVTFSPVSRWTITRYAFRLGLFLTIVVSAWTWFVSPWIALGFLAVLPIAWGISSLRFLAIGWSFDSRLLVIRGGVLRRVVKVVPIDKVQATFVNQSYLQRRLGIATLRVMTAGHPLSANLAGVADLPLSIALDLQERLIISPHLQPVG